jgi:hypothetical protein
MCKSQVHNFRRRLEAEILRDHNGSVVDFAWLERGRENHICCDGAEGEDETSSDTVVKDSLGKLEDRARQCIEDVLWFICIRILMACFGLSHNIAFGAAYCCTIALRLVSHKLATLF